MIQDVRQQLKQEYGSLFANQVLASLSFQNIPPAPILADVIRHYWSVSSSGEPFGSSTYTDGGMGLVFDLDNPRLSVFQGPQMPARLQQFHQPRRLLGVRFTIGGGDHFFRGHQEHWHQDTLLSDLDYSLFNQMQDQLQSCDRLSERIKVLDQTLSQYLLTTPVKSHKLSPILSLLLPDSQVIKIESIADQAGVSQRKLNRLFKKQSGYSPKQIGKIFRVDACRRILSAKESWDHQDIVYRLGYYDQAHFIREFRELTQTTPEAYRARKQQALWNK